MRCPSCSKFVPLQFEDIEEPDLEIDESGRVTGGVRIVRSCEECGDELKEATLEIDVEVELPKGHDSDGHDLSVDVDSVEQVEEGGGRYAKSYFGAAVSFSVRCSCQKEGSEPMTQGNWTDKIPASHMDEMG